MRSTVSAEGSADSRFGGSILVILKQVNQHITRHWEKNSIVTHLDSSKDSQLTFHPTA